MSCDHKWTESIRCTECGQTIEHRAEAFQKFKLDFAKLRDAFEDAVALLRDWEDYDPADRECTWKQRRDEFLAEHEEAGR